MPAGFFGTRADLLLDLVIASLVLVVPVLLYCWSHVRRGRYARHTALQLTLFVVLGAAVLAFELHLRQIGGIFAATRASSFAGTATLNGWIYVHTVFAIGMALVWLLLVAGAMWLFPRPPRPVAGSHVHRWLGRLGVVLALGAGITAIPLYIYGFAL
jgi:hypothetical protein